VLENPVERVGKCLEKFPSEAEALRIVPVERRLDFQNCLGRDFERQA
jgi:hypothetical protein